MADENPIEKLRPGQILADSAVTDYIKAMGIAIAEAQLQLDINSLQQIEEYEAPRRGLDNKSLLQLGLSPPFYHFQHADLSVSMQIVMKIGEQTTTGIGGKLDFGVDTGGAVGAASAREAQVTVKSVPASVTVDGKKTDTTGTEVEAGAEQLAAALRAGPFERAFAKTERKPVTAALEPAAAKNPILTSNAVAFIKPAETSVGVIRIEQTPVAAEKFTLAPGKATGDVPPSANRTLYARAVTAAINGVGGFKARLINDAGGDNTAPDAPGTLAIALFDTNLFKIKPEAIEELDLAAKAIKAGNFTINIFGYADKRGEVEDNDILGKNRADAVANHLVSQGVARDKIAKTESGGERRWDAVNATTNNQQFRRAEVVIAGSTDLIIIVEDNGTQLQATPTPDKTGGGAGNGFIFARKFDALPIDGTAVKLGASATSVGIKGDAVNDSGTVFASGSPEAHAFNLARDINAKTDTHKVRATRNGAVVMLANADDAVVIDLVTLSANNIKLEAGGGATLTKPLAGIAAGAGAPKEKTRYTFAVGITADYRKSRQFEQSVNGNSAISARLVSVPAPVEFLDELKTYLGQIPQPRAPQ
jgi:outer membrane protein OmpA-like peptidoglycan-associated protein